MKNMFDSDNYPDIEPTELINGSRWVWKRSDITDVYPTASYTLKYSVSSFEGDRDYVITADKVNSAHVVEVASSVATTYKPGEYLWKAIIVRDSDSEEVVVSEGMFSVKAATGDVSTHTYKTLEAIRANIENTATKNQQSYSINGRSLSKYSLEELTNLEKQYLARWNNEKTKLNAKYGRAKSKDRILVRLNA